MQLQDIHTRQEDLQDIHHLQDTSLHLLSAAVSSEPNYKKNQRDLCNEYDYRDHIEMKTIHSTIEVIEVDIKEL